MALSKGQTVQLAALLGIMLDEVIPEYVIEDFRQRGWVTLINEKPRLTASGLDEKNRLCHFAGLSVKFLSEAKDERVKR